MAEGDFDRWNDEKLRYSMSRLIPDGWFFAVNTRAERIVGTGMCLHDSCEGGRFGEMVREKTGAVNAGELAALLKQMAMQTLPLQGATQPASRRTRSVHLDQEADTAGKAQ